MEIDLDRLEKTINPFFKSYIDKIPKKHLRTIKSKLDVYSRLCYILFLKREECYKDILGGIVSFPFKDYESWTFIEAAIVLLAYTTDDLSLKEVLRSRLEEVLNMGDELQVLVNNNVHNRFLKGEVFYNREKVTYSSLSDEIDDDISYLINLLKLHIFISAAQIDKDDLDREIKKYINKISKFIEDNGVDDLYPLSL